MNINTAIHGTRWIRIAGWLTFILGLIHIAATPFIFTLSASLFSNPDARSNLYMFEMTGLAVIFCGWLVIYTTRGWQDGQRWAWHLCLGAGIFLFILGSSAVLFMPDNPFAFISLLMPIVVILPVWLYRKDFVKKTI